MSLVRGRGVAFWWCALPDTSRAAPAAAALDRLGVVAARHRSGRPWIVTHPSTRIRMLDHGAVRLAAVGEVLPTTEQLAAAAAAAQPVAGFAGAHLLRSGRDGRTRVFADAAGFRRVFTARVHGTTVAASHASLLRQLAGAPVDPVWVAAKLLTPEMPHALRQTRSPFVGIDPVPAGHLADFTDDHARIRHWWRPPDPVLELDDGGEALRAALTSAVSQPAASGEGPVSVQLSGGLDSAALACLAAAARPLLVTTAGTGPVAEDLAWARRIAACVPGAQHRVFGDDEIPLLFADLEHAPAGDEPCSFTAGAARQRHVAAVLAGHDVQLHLNGQGGDEVLLVPLAYLPGLLRRRPRTAWRHLRGQAALRHLPTTTLMRRAATEPKPYGRWLATAAGSLRVNPGPAAALTGWEAPALLPPWASGHACELATAALTAAPAQPVHEEPGVHAAVTRIRASAYRAGLYRDAMAAAGVPTAMPFFDHDVLSACLATRPEARTDPWQPKPLLRAALSGLVPDQVLARRTKGHYNADIYRGWAAHHEQVRDLLAGSQLAELGLIEQDVLNHHLDRFGPSGLPPAFVTDVVALEVWLRALSPTTTGGC